MPVFSTACPRNCYSTCSFKVRVEEGQIIEFDSHQGNRATPEGICLKGLSYFERYNSPDRILHPLKKSSAGGYDEITWEDALNEIAGKLDHFKAHYGPWSILYYAASGMSGLLNGFSQNFWRSFGGATTMYGNLCWPAGLEAVRLTLGEIKHNAPWDLVNARLIILWGKNPAETNIHQMVFIEKAQKEGAKLVVIDPRRTQSAEQADLLIQPKPGTDAVLALGIANILARDGMLDREFLAKHVIGYEEFIDSLNEWSPARVSSICDIPQEFIELLAGMIGGCKPMTIIPGYGMQRFSNGGQTIRTLLALNILTGNIARPGAGFGYADLQSYVFDAVKEPESYYPPKQPDGVFRRTISMARLGTDMLETWDPEIKMIWVERGNPVCQNPDTGKIREAFRKLTYRVVVEQFMTDTAKEADIILPAKNMFEQTDIIGSYWNPYIQYRSKVMEPLGEVLPETSIYYLLAQKLGIATVDLLAPEAGQVNDFLNKQVSRFPEINWDKLKEGPQLPSGYHEVAFHDLTFPTDSGKIELFSDKAHKNWDVHKLPGYSPLEVVKEDKIKKYPLHLLTPNTKNRIHSQFGNLKMISSVAGESMAGISIQDSLTHNIKKGDSIRIYNDKGEIFLKARPDPGIRPGCVEVYNGLWINEGGTPNFLTTGKETDMGHGTAFHDTMVQIEKS